MPLIIIFILIFFILHKKEKEKAQQRAEKIQKLKNYGTLIEAKIDDVYEKSEPEGPTYYVLYAHSQLPNSDKVFSYKQCCSSFNVKNYVSNYQTKNISVYVDLENPRNYYIDFESLKNKTK